MGLANYVKETRGELKHVSWPTRKQAVAFTAIVIVICVGLALYLGVFDYLFAQLLKYVITNF